MIGNVGAGDYELNDVEQYENMLAVIPCGIVITAADDKFTILFANQYYYNMVGYDKEKHTKIFGNVGTDTLHTDDVEMAVISANEQLDESGEFSVKGRISHNRKGYIWVQLSGKLQVLPSGEKRIYIVVVDITEHQETLERLGKEKLFNELVADLSDEAFFDCDLLSGAMRCSRSFAVKFGLSEEQLNYEEVFIRLGIMTENGVSDQAKHLLHTSDDIVEEEFRIKTVNGEDAWYVYRGSIIRDIIGIPVRIIGKFIDITRHKVQIDELSVLAQRDQLTGLYNKATTERLIKDTLATRCQQGASCALLIIDIDNFKNINDRLGHLYGDVVLAQLAEHLSGIFSEDDVVGRVGGDEFFVFTKNCDAVEMLTKKATEICSMFRKTYSEGDTIVAISASIGIAIYRDNGLMFDEIYRMADAALYDAKAHGKNTFSFYSEKLEQSYVSERTEIDTDIVNKSFRDNRIEYAFRLLYGSENPEQSIRAVLQLLTESFGFSRGYIFEMSVDGRYSSNTFEWCEKGITAEIHNLQNLPIEAMESACTAFNDTGMFTARSINDLPQIEIDLLRAQGIISMFLLGIMDQGRLFGFIGFDDCVLERVPSESEMDEIRTVCQVLATFLLKHRNDQREVFHLRAIENAMDHLSSYAYVVDCENHLVLYENRAVIHATGSSSIGKKCYKAYRGNELQCDDCPIQYLSDINQRHVNQFYSNEFGGEIRAEAVIIDWENDKKVILLCGVDISKL